MKINSKISSIKEIFDGKTRYIVPSSHDKLYDMPLLNSLFDMIENIVQCYQVEKTSPCFLGTVILSGKNEIIDGSLTLQFLSIFLKELSFLFPNSEELKSLTFDWLETKVSSEEQKNLSRYFLSKNSDETDRQDESFGEVADQIRQNYTFNFFKNKKNIDDGFMGYLVNNVVFNVIEMEEISSWDSDCIFNTLNSDRKFDLTDMFCQSLSGYLTEKKGMSESDAKKAIEDLHLNPETEDDIEELYRAKIQGMDLRPLHHYPLTEDILKNLRLVLIAKYSLPVSHIFQEDNLFFRWLFSSLSKKDGEKSEEMKEVELDLDEIKRIIDITNNVNYDTIDGFAPGTNNAKVLHEILGFSRYSDINDIIVPYLFFHKDDTEGMHKVLIELDKLYFIHKICFPNKNDSSMKEILKDINKPCDEIVGLIREKKSEITRDAFKQKLEKLSKLASMEEKKSAIKTRMSPVLKLFEFLKMKDNQKSVFKDWNFSCLNTTIQTIQDGKNTDSWCYDSRDSLGNTVLIEREIIPKAWIKENDKPLPFLKKKKIFKKSKFYTARLLSRKKDWTEEDAKKRQEEITEEVTNFLYA